ncbi:MULTISPECIES: chemotaxis protein CheD [unclassified Yoonia]|uniref:chemotaxis protein CheD n=1 Tax=unclassified Yoonia TaxID=2629118 RepID=UPI002AFE73A6|nr:MULTISPECIES: chemotaxis protein CheD [unclassified Yoonia]
MENVTTCPLTITVVQGDFAVSADPAVMMSTVLGSCVAVCLFDSQKRVGGMNHFLLATGGDADTEDLKYGVNAMELLINRILQIGGDRRRLQAKVFGGARMTIHARDIGQSNADFAMEFLDREGIACLSQSVGGTLARRVQFVPTTGAARQMQIAGAPPAPTIIAPPRPAPDITLF